MSVCVCISARIGGRERGEGRKGRRGRRTYRREAGGKKGEKEEVRAGKEGRWGVGRWGRRDLYVLPPLLFGVKV